MRAANLIIDIHPRNSKTTLRWVSRLLLLAGIFALSYVAYIYASAYVFQKAESISLSQPIPPGAPLIGHVIPEGGVIGRIEIERLGLSAIVAEGASPSVLQHAVGHVPGTAFPGDPGNVALSGHRDTFFRPLRNVREGDVITVETRSSKYRYVVESTTIVPPTAIEVLRSSSRDELTLITCYPFSYIGSAPNRFIVRAHITGGSAD